MKVKSLFGTMLLLGVVAIAGAVDQPHMQAARTSLQTAQAQLQKATADTGGHRVKAIDLVNSAIAEVNAGIAFDRRHNHASTLTTETLFPDQPHMQNALTALENAKDSLNQATADKGGHRAKALDYVRDAINEVKKGIEAAR